MNRKSLQVLSIPLLAAVIAACSATAATQNPTLTPLVTPTPAVSAAAVATPTQNACDKSVLTTLTSGKLTIGTDNPAYPPYFAAPASGNATAPWELGDPTNGQGFESAVAYAVAGKLGYSASDVAWTVVPFDNSYAPGTKPFDLTSPRFPIRRTGLRLSICRMATTSSTSRSWL
jgi:polar amino acid transport system substrate-binding protein